MTLIACVACGREGLLKVNGGPRPHVHWGIMHAPYAWCPGGVGPVLQAPAPADLVKWRTAERAEAMGQ